MFLNDKEVAVVIDCLTIFRENERVGDTPNVDSALAKINGLITPATNGLYVYETAPSIRPIAEDMHYFAERVSQGHNDGWVNFRRGLDALDALTGEGDDLLEECLAALNEET